MRSVWSEEKNALLKACRGLGFEDVIEALEAGAFHPVRLWNEIQIRLKKVGRFTAI
jgi:hypothetical protein